MLSCLGLSAVHLASDLCLIPLHLALQTFLQRQVDVKQRLSGNMLATLKQAK